MGHVGTVATVPTRNDELLVRAFAELADSLVDNFDVVDLLTMLADRCVVVVDVAAAGLMLASAGGELRVLASSSEAMRVLEVFEAQAEFRGPADRRAHRSRRTSIPAAPRWPPDVRGRRCQPGRARTGRRGR